MKLIVASDLETRTYQELSAIYSGVSKFLVQRKARTGTPRPWRCLDVVGTGVGSAIYAE
jgi:hypothetical protein